MSEANKSADQIFDEAFDIEDENARDAFIRDKCGDDDDLRAEVESLFAGYERANELLADRQLGISGSAEVLSALLEASDSSASGDMVGQFIGSYRLVEQIGEGGFGVVYRAQQTDEIHRDVALKILSPRMNTEEVLKRFDAERQILALMDDSSIPKIFGAGATEDGRPYFAMELVNGTPITTYCAEKNLSVDKRLQLFVTVCRAVHHAHQRGIIHRDIKPSNVLVVEIDGEPVPKVIDFGISKAIESAEQHSYGNAGPLARVCPTNTPAIQGTMQLSADLPNRAVGTPLYMSPEQASGDRGNIDTRSDVYSLGILLYEMLTDRLAVDEAELTQLAEATEVQQRIRATILEAPPSRTATTAIQRDVDWIVIKAIQQHKDLRYESVHALSLDIHRFLTYQAIEAHPPSLLYRFGKFARRNRIAVAAAGVCLATLVSAVIVSMVFAMQAIDAEDLATTRLDAVVAEQERTQAARQLAERQRERADAEAAQAIADRDIAINELREHRKTLEGYLKTITSAELLRDRRFAPLKRELLNGAREHYQRFLNRFQDSMLLEPEVAEALFQVAYINSETTGSTIEDSLDKYQLALKAFQHVAQSAAETRDYKKRVAEIYNNLGLLLQDKGDTKGAEESYLKAIASEEVLLSEQPDDVRLRFDLARVHTNVGRLRRDEGSRDEALAAFEKARNLLEDVPRSVKSAYDQEYENELASIHNQIGLLHNGANNPTAALDHFQKAESLARSLSKTNPDAPQYKDRLVATLANIAWTYTSAGWPREALPYYDEAVGLHRQLVSQHPTVEKYQYGMGLVLNNISGAYQQLGQVDQAVQFTKEAQSIFRRLHMSDPSVVIYAIDYAGSLANEVGMDKLANADDAISTLNEAVSILENVLSREPANVTGRRTLRNTYGLRSGFLDEQGEYADAVEDLDRAIEIDDDRPRSGILQQRRILVLCRSGSFDETQQAIDDRAKECTTGDQFFILAGVSVMCLASLRDHAELEAVDQAKYTDAFAETAIELLQRAKGLGFFENSENARLLTDATYFMALSDRADYESFVNSLGPMLP